MADVVNGGPRSAAPGVIAMEPQVQHQHTDKEQQQIIMTERLRKLYPAVDEEKTPLPRTWSTKDKYSYIGLSQNNLRVHYKGHGKTHRDAASVQATHPIPATCGLYYFEVKIVSKGRDGYMGIGLSAQGVNMNRLPGWDKLSYGYHGDDGHSFCSSGTGQPYGPTFTTGDVIGCGVNLVDNTCFYTKNGHPLGTAFTDLPPNLYPTVGLQTPGEVVDANFGQEPFVFDIEDMIKELNAKVKNEIYNYPIAGSHAEWQSLINKMVSTYLVHQGYYATAQTFAHITDHPFTEDLNAIKNRQIILKLVLAGRISEAIERTSRSYPGLLETNQNLLFMLKCRQFVEMVNGSDVDACHSKKNTTSSCSTTTAPSTATTASGFRAGSPIQTSVIQSTKSYSNTSNNKSSPKQQNLVEEMNNQNNMVAAGNTSAQNGSTGGAVPTPYIGEDDGDVEMDTSEECQNGHGDAATATAACNGKSSPSNSAVASTNGYQNGNSHHNHSVNEENGTTQDKNCCDNDEEDMDVDVDICRKSCTKPAVERILEFGRELYTLSQRLTVDKPTKIKNQKMLEDAFSLLAYSNPWASPVGWQLQSSEREVVCSSLNSAILESIKKPRRPPLEMTLCHAAELIKLMSTTGLGACAFATLVDMVDQ